MVNKNNTTFNKIFHHPDREEIIAKLIIGTSATEIHEWLSNNYGDISQKKFVISAKNIKAFQDNYLDIYQQIRDDIDNTKRATKSIQTVPSDQDFQLIVSNNPTYKDMVKSIADTELDNAVNIKRMLANMIQAIELRTSQFYDEIQNSGQFNTKNERILIEYFEVFGSNLERWHKIVEGGPDQIIQHNVNVQSNLDQYVSIIYEAIKSTLNQMDVEAALLFMEKFNSIISKTHLPTEAQLTQEQKTKEIQLLNENITQTLLEPTNV